MPNTDQEARNAISAFILPFWNTATGSAFLAYDNMPGEPPDALPLWGRLHIRGQTSGKVSLGNTNARFRRTGTVFFQVFVTPDKGMETINAAATALAEAFEDAGPSDADGIWFRDTAVRPVGSRDGTYFQVNVETTFTYDRNT